MRKTQEPIVNTNPSRGGGSAALPPTISGATTMQTMVERLRVEHAGLLGPELAEGRRLGRQWAESHASLAELGKLELLAERKDRSGSWRVIFPGPQPPAIVLASHLMAIGADGEMAQSYFAKAGVARPLDRTVEFWGAWIAGAAAAWRSVEDLL